MPVLGLSSATKVISIGLIDDQQVLVETMISDIRAERVIFYIREAGIEPKQIEGVAVAIGPGSYAGLRGGLTAAKSLAQTLKIPLVGVSTLEAMAYHLIDIEGTMAVILDAKADEYNFALFGAFQGELKRLTDDLVITKNTLSDRLSRISGDIWVVGSIKAIKDIKGIAGKKVPCHPSGVNVARLGQIRIKAGHKDDPLELVPRYSHKPKFKTYKRKG